MTGPAQSPPVHAGIEIRQSVIPADLSVTKVAKMLGVGRSALSNLLNGKAALSPEMAMRFEKVFGVSSKDLAAKQARYDEHEGRARENQIAVRPYTPTYLQITADQIAAWSEKINARSELAAFLRILVHSTGANLKRVDFPAFDNSQQKGWDGWIDSGSATPWIPFGTSCWEFGCNETVQPKADEDYAARTRKVPPAERKITTFVFVTPRNWPKKREWAKGKKGQSLWKDVWAFDASDLEQWLELSIPAQARFREFQGVGIEHVVSLDQIWDKWACATEPKLSQDLFVPAVERHRDRLEKWFRDTPLHPLIVSAGSSREALAFLACAIARLDQSCPGFYERAIVISSRDAFNSISRSFQNFVAIIASSEVEQDLAGFHKKTHAIIVRERNTLINNADITLDPFLGYKDFQNALRQMGLGDQRIYQLARESARSPSILRRRLLKIPDVDDCPSWMEDNTIVRGLIPLIFVGAWDSSVTEDQQILCYLAGRKYTEVERVVALLQQECEPPVWSVGSCSGIVSKIEALYVASDSIIYDDLMNFLSIAKEVLSELDKYSPMLRQGICDTLVLMAVHGNALFEKRLGIDLQVEVSKVVDHLLTPSAESTWLSQREYLSQYAEAAPDTFLQIVEDDLSSQSPKIAVLFTPMESDLLTLMEKESCYLGDGPHERLLWALEVLAWEAQQLMRVTFILTQLCQWKVDGHSTATPLSTLESIFCFWMPQTAVTLDKRNRALKVLAEKKPAIGWQICVNQLQSTVAAKPHSILASEPEDFYSCWNVRPRWRTEAHEAGQIVKATKERRKALDYVIELALSWPSYDAYMLGDLVECFDALDNEHRNLVWDRIVAWHDTRPGDAQKAVLRERIRCNNPIRHSQSDNLADALRNRARAHDVYALLEPSDPVARHSWLFLREWVEVPADEFQSNEFRRDEWAAQIERQRREALKEVWQQSGLGGILDLCRSGEGSRSLGFHLAEIHADIKPTAEFIQELLSDESAELQHKFDQCIGGFLSKLDLQQRSNTLLQLLTRMAGQNESCVRLLQCAPFDGDTWHHVDMLPESLKQKYWRKVNPCGQGYQGTSDVAKFVDELLEVDRPCAAFYASQRMWGLLDSKRLVRLLTEVAINNSEPSTHYQIFEGRIAADLISKALDVLEERGDTPPDELAHLELMFIEELDHTEHGIHNLETQLAKTPTLFVQMLVWVFKRNDDGEDPTESRPSNSNHRALVKSKTNVLFRRASRVPGTQADGSINLKELKKWLEQARSRARQYGLMDIGDRMIGQLLSRCRAGADGVWPCEPVRDAIEGIASTEIRIGMIDRICNSQEATFHIGGGERERELAGLYRSWSNKIDIEHPYTSELLERIACRYDGAAELWDARVNVRQRSDIRSNI